ncbi:hypothetical protein [uncultured Lamprocystis sp.]|jgi:Spy/CpxP family protein refolding chaperone|nr:hypothetical protein [uncultured Lamprocystis sp.]
MQSRNQTVLILTPEQYAKLFIAMQQRGANAEQPLSTPDPDALEEAPHG